MLNDMKNNNINFTTTESNRQDRERSKREDSHKCCCRACKYDVSHHFRCPLFGLNMQQSCEMRCSEHCGNTVRDK